MALVIKKLPEIKKRAAGTTIFHFQFSQMRVSERKGCLQTLPSGSILDKTTFCQFSIQSQTPPLLRSTPSNLEGDNFEF